MTGPFRASAAATERAQACFEPRARAGDVAVGDGLADVRPPARITEPKNGRTNPGAGGLNAADDPHHKRCEMRTTRRRAWTVWLPALFLQLVAGLAQAAQPPQPTYGTAVKDGNPDTGGPGAEWLYRPSAGFPLGFDLWAGMFTAGDPDKPRLANAYLRYDCASQKLFVLVLQVPGVPLLTSPTGNAWANFTKAGSKLYNDNNAGDVLWFGLGYDGDPTHARGYEAAIPLAPGSWPNFIVHVEALVGSSMATAGTPGFSSGNAPLEISCPGPDYPQIQLLKSTNGEDANLPPGPELSPGQAVTWSYLVSNPSGTTALYNVTVTDDQLPASAIVCPSSGSNVIALLAPGASETCIAKGTAVPGQYANIGTAQGSANGITVQDSDPSHYNDPPGGKPAIAIVKTTNGGDGGEVMVGDPVLWSYLVTDTGDVPLNQVTVLDDQLPASAIDCGGGSNVVASLAAGASITCTAQGIAVHGNYANLGSVSGTADDGEVVTASDPSSYVGLLAAIQIVKTTNGSDGVLVLKGAAVLWSYAVTNIGEVPLSQVTVTDDKLPASAIDCGDGSNVIGLLAAGASATCTAQGTAMAGDYANLGTATGTAPNGKPVTATDASSYFGAAPEVTLVKTTNGSDGLYISVGKPVVWKFVVSNAGNVALTNVTVTDDQLDPGLIVCAGGEGNVIALLPVGASASCEAQGVAIAGPYKNLGSVVATAPIGPDVGASDPSDYFGSAPAIAIVKTTNGSDGPLLWAGDAITWSYELSNTGNVPLKQVTVTDDKLSASAIDCGGGSNVVPSLAVGASVTCTAKGTAEPGAYQNLGTARGTPPVDDDVKASDPSSYSGFSNGTLALTETSCSLFASHNVLPLLSENYLFSKGKIGSVAPGAFFYYAKVDLAAGTAKWVVAQANDASWPNVGTMQLILWNAKCEKVFVTATVSGNEVTFPTAGLPAGRYFISVKYEPNSLVGKSLVTPYPTVTYSFGAFAGTTLVPWSKASVKFVPKN
jgi:uncharacterized repeat protein (TIGR01451 family)